MYICFHKESKIEEGANDSGRQEGRHQRNHGYRSGGGVMHVIPVPFQIVTDAAVAIEHEVRINLQLDLLETLEYFSPPNGLLQRDALLVALLLWPVKRARLGPIILERTAGVDASMVGL